MDESDFQTSFGITRKTLVQKLRALADDLEDMGPDDLPSGPMVALRNWAIGSRSVSCLIGNADHHPILGSSRPVWSSQLFYFNSERGIARSFSRWYRLENKADPQFWDGAIFEG